MQAHVLLWHHSKLWAWNAVWEERAEYRGGEKIGERNKEEAISHWEANALASALTPPAPGGGAPTSKTRSHGSKIQDPDPLGVIENVSHLPFFLPC